MRRTLGKRVTQWKEADMSLVKTLGETSPTETVGTRGHLSLNTIMASETIESCHDGKGLMITGISSLSLIDRGSPVQGAPLRSFLGRREPGWMIRKIHENTVIKVIQGNQTIMKLGEALCFRTGQMQQDMVFKVAP